VNEDPVPRRLKNLAQIGAEAALLVGNGRTAYVADTMEAQHTYVDWVGIDRMRDLEAHGDRVNDDLLWTGLTVRIPALLTELGL
jgi:uncharacterized protein with HEPN domain